MAEYLCAPSLNRKEFTMSYIPAPTDSPNKSIAIEQMITTTARLGRSFFCLFAAAAFTALNATAQTEGETHDPGELVDALHTAFGKHHARAVHAKGIILEGEFTPDPHTKDLTKAPHLQSKSCKVIVRFSNFTGIPDIPDNSPNANPRGMGIRFYLPDGLTTDIVGHSFNGFPVPNSDQFRELLLSLAASGPDDAKPTALDKFLESHPVAKTFLTTQKIPASYATIAYFGVNSLKFTNAKGESHFVRYQFVPEKEELLTDAQREKASPSYLMDDIKTRVAAHPIVFKMFAQLAGSGDKIDDPSIAWPDSRKRVPLGKIEIKKLTANTPEEDKALVFSPSNVPEGIETADPMLKFRSRAYSISGGERQ